MSTDPITACAQWQPTIESVTAQWPSANQDAVLAQTLASGTATETSGHRPRRPHTRSIATISLTVVAVVAAGVIANAVRDHGTSAGHGPPPTLGVPVGPIGSKPFIGAYRVTLSQASRLIGYPIPAPSTELANPGNLSKVWFARLPQDEGGRSVELDYIKTGIAVDYTSPSSVALTNPLAVYTKMAKGLNLTVRTVHGVPALVVGATSQPSLDASNGQPGFVDMVLNGEHIVVMGNHSAADLVAVAESIPGPDQVTAPAT
jgi:hypothetical protein